MAAEPLGLVVDVVVQSLLWQAASKFLADFFSAAAAAPLGVAEILGGLPRRPVGVC